MSPLNLSALFEYLVPMLWVYGHYKCFTLSVWGSTLDADSSKVDPRAVRVNANPVWKGRKTGWKFCLIETSSHLISKSGEHVPNNITVCTQA